MAWTWRVVLRPDPADPTQHPDPGAAWRAAEASRQWPDALVLSGEWLDAAGGAGWSDTLRRWAERGVAVLCDDTPWEPGRPVARLWPPGDPTTWDPALRPDAWDADSACWREPVGAVWWRRQPPAGDWRLGVVRIGAWPDDAGGAPPAPADVGAALRAASPVGALRVRQDERRWWVAWSMRPGAPTGGEWARALWAALGPVRVGVVMVQSRDSWPQRRDRAYHLADTGPGRRVGGAAAAAVEGHPSSADAAAGDADRTASASDAHSAETGRALPDARSTSQAASSEGVENGAAAAHPGWLVADADAWWTAAQGGPWGVVVIGFAAPLDAAARQEAAGWAEAAAPVDSHGAWTPQGDLVLWWPLAGHPSPTAWAAVVGAAAGSWGGFAGGAVCSGRERWVTTVAQARRAARRRGATQAVGDGSEPRSEGEAEVRGTDTPGPEPTSPPPQVPGPEASSLEAPASGGHPATPRGVEDPGAEGATEPVLGDLSADRASKPPLRRSLPAPPSATDAPPRLVRQRSIPWQWRPGTPMRWDGDDDAGPPAQAPSAARGAEPTEIPAPPSIAPVEPASAPAGAPGRPKRAVRWRRRTRGGDGQIAEARAAEGGDARPALTRPWAAWVWGTQRHAGATTVAVALARWLAWWQRTPVILLDGHPEQPGVKAVLRRDRPWPGLGWESTWQAGVPWTPPPQALDLGAGLQVWALGRPLRLPGLDRWWPEVLRHVAAEAVVVVDGGLRPPPVAVALPVCVVGGLEPRPDAPQATWFARRRGDGRPRCLVVPTEPLGADGVGSVAWMACWEPLAEVLVPPAAAQRP